MRVAAAVVISDSDSDADMASDKPETVGVEGADEEEVLSSTMTDTGSDAENDDPDDAGGSFIAADDESYVDTDTE